MSKPISNRRPESSDRSHCFTLTGNLVVAGFVGSLFGLVDFFLFETRGIRPVMQEFVFSKPSFWSLSLLSYQVITCMLLAMILCLSAFLVIGFLSRRFRFFRHLSPPAMTVLSLFFVLIGLRLMKNSGQSVSLILLSFWSLMLTLGILLIETKFLKKSGKFHHRYTNRILTISFVAALLVISISFLAPDFRSATLRTSGDTENVESSLPNVLLVVLDTVRADHLSCYGYPQNETPNIDAISREGLLFLNAFSTAPWTLPSHASMFTGLHTFQHGTDWGHKYLAETHLTLAEHLGGKGYRTAGFSENPFVGTNTGLARGFIEFHEPWRRPMIVRAIKKLLAQLGLRKDPLEYAGRTSGLFRRWLIDGGDGDRPFFAYINFMAAHLPRYPRPRIGDGRWAPDTLQKIEPVNLVPERYYLESYRLDQHDLSVMREIYDQEISYMDEYIGGVVDFLNQQNVLENTLLIVTSDHGENFGEHGYFEHQLCLYNSLIHVPLIIRFPKLFPPQNIEDRFSTVDLFQAVVDIVSAKSRRLRGSEIASEDLPFHQPIGNEVIISEYANGLDMMKGAIRREAPNFDFSPYDRDLKSLIMGDYKYIWDSNGGEELYDISADPDEETDIAARERSIVLRYRQILAQVTSSEGSVPVSENHSPPIDAATRDALRALGYEF